MNKYEIALILSADIEDGERAAIIDRIKGLIERFNGKPGTVDEWGKKRLAYEIRKQREAFYYFVHFESEDAETSNELEKQLRIMDNVLRYLIVRDDIEREQPIVPDESLNVSESEAEKPAEEEKETEEAQSDEAQAEEAPAEEIKEDEAQTDDIQAEEAEEAQPAEDAQENAAEEDAE